MKAKNVLDKLKDMKLRRWGPAEYTEAKNSNEGESGQIDYETIYQFYKQKFIESDAKEYIEPIIENGIFPEHYSEVPDLHNQDIPTKSGIYKNMPTNGGDGMKIPLFNEIDFAEQDIEQDINKITLFIQYNVG